MKGKRFLGFLLALSGCFPIVRATTDDVSTDSPVVSVPVFIENFDDCIGGNGGNDNVWSGLDRLAFGDDNLYTGKGYITGSHVYRMNQCVAVGSPSVLGILKIFNIPFSGSGSIYMRMGCYKGTEVDVSVYADDDENPRERDNFFPVNRSFGYYLLNSKFPVEDVKESISLFIQSPSEKNIIFIDEISVYQDEPLGSDKVKDASRIILKGDYTESDLETLNRQLRQNSHIMIVDVTKVDEFPENGVIETGNPNCLFYDKKIPVLGNTVNRVSNGTCEQLILKDNGGPFCNVKDFTAENVSYDRSFTTNTWSTVCIPFTADTKFVPGIEVINQFSEYDGAKGEIRFTDTDKLTASKPRVLKMSVAQPFLNLKNIRAEVRGSTPWVKSVSDDMVSFGGTYETQDLESTTDEYIYGLSGGVFKIAKANTHIAPFRSFLKIKSAVFTDGADIQSVPTNLIVKPTSVRPIITVDENQNVVVYNLQGRLVYRGPVIDLREKLAPGLYIVNGKKIKF